MQLDLQNPTSIINETLTSWVESLIASLPNIILAIVVFGLFYGFSRLVKGPVRIISRKSTNNLTLQKLIVFASQLLVFAIGIVLVLQILHLDKAVTSVLAGVGIVGIALGFAFQDIAANIISGIFIAFTPHLRVGDIVNTNGFFGKVFNINLRNTVLDTPDGKRIVIPNKEVFLNPLTNYTETPSLLVTVECGVSYNDNLKEVKNTTIKTIKKLDFIEKDKDIEFFYSEFANSSINFKVRFWMKFTRQADSLNAESETIIALKDAFDKAGITIPYPISTIISKKTL